MAIRIGDYVLSGELRNTRPNGVFGWIEFAPDYGIRMELTGNFSATLAGKHIKFRVRRPEQAETPTPENLPEVIDGLADRQIGVVGDMLLRKIRVPDLPIDDFLALQREEREKHLVEKESLYLEWFSQNGRVVAELVEPEVEFVDDAGEATGESASFEPLEDGAYGIGFTEVHIDEDGVMHTERYDLDADEDDEDGEDDDPYGLFGSDLSQHVAESLGTELPAELDDEDDSDTGKSRRWDEVIPDIDPETKEMYEQWDEIFEGKKDEPISYLFQTPLKLPKAENVATDEEAEPLVRAILAQLALLSVALDVCEHFTPLETYRLLMKDILPTAKVHPNLAASDMVQHYSTSDYCQKCDEEFDAEYDAASGDPDTGDADHGEAEPDDEPPTA